MSEETIDDIVASMRRGTKLPGYWRSCDLNKILEFHADRIEAALKRERAAFDCECAGIAELAAKEEAARHRRESVDCNRTGNAAEMRDALVSIREYITGKRNYIGNLLELILNWCDRALERTPRNCDVGTADEQVDRHRDWCIRDNDCSYCCNDCRDCFARWAQEGASK